MPKKKTYQPPFFFVNLEKHLLRAFDLWVVKNPPALLQAKRSLIFITALLATIYWPITDLFTQFLVLSIAWIILSLTNQNVNRWLLLFHIMLNITWLYLLVRFSLSFLE
jgi:hypothetical protein